MARSELGTQSPGGSTGNGLSRPTPTSRTVGAKRTLPGSRATIGGLLMALAAGGVLLAYTGSSSGPDDALIVVTEDVAAGQVIDHDALAVEKGDLPEGIDATFDTPEEVAGRVALVPLAKGDIVQASAVGSTPRPSVAHEMALTLPRENVAVGRLKRGERVDVYVTTEDRTSSVVRGAEVLQLTEGDDDSLTSDRDVSLVVGVATAEEVAALVHSLRTGDVTVVRSTGPGTSDQPVSHGDAPSAGEDTSE